MCFGLSLPPPLFFHDQEEYARSVYTCSWAHGLRRQIEALDWHMQLRVKEPCFHACSPFVTSSSTPSKAVKPPCCCCLPSIRTQKEAWRSSLTTPASGGWVTRPGPSDVKPCGIIGCSATLLPLSLRLMPLQAWLEQAIKDSTGKKGAALSFALAELQKEKKKASLSALLSSSVPLLLPLSISPSFPSRLSLSALLCPSSPFV